MPDLNDFLSKVLRQKPVIILNQPAKTIKTGISNKSLMKLINSIVKSMSKKKSLSAEDLKKLMPKSTPLG